MNGISRGVAYLYAPGFLVGRERIAIFMSRQKETSERNGCLTRPYPRYVSSNERKNRRNMSEI